jgi:hypothetical protein
MGGMADSSDFEVRLRELAGADVVAFGGVGLMNRVLPVTEAYRAASAAVLRERDAIRPHLDWLLRHGTPAGKVYGATLLRELDPDAAEDAWRQLATEGGDVTTFSGCIMNKISLADYAAAQV